MESKLNAKNLNRSIKAKFIGPPEIAHKKNKRLARKRWLKYYRENRPKHLQEESPEVRGYEHWPDAEKTYKELQQARLKELQEYRSKPKWEPKRIMA